MYRGSESVGVCVYIYTTYPCVGEGESRRVRVSLYIYIYIVHTPVFERERGGC